MAGLSAVFRWKAENDARGTLAYAVNKENAVPFVLTERPEDAFVGIWRRRNKGTQPSKWHTALVSVLRNGPSAAFSAIAGIAKSARQCVSVLVESAIRHDQYFSTVGV